MRPPKSSEGPLEPRRRPSRDPVRVASERRGLLAEHLAALILMGKGYRILSRRWRTVAGEVDLVAVRGRRLAFVEVKQRPTLAAAFEAIGDAQGRRIRDAADLWLARHAGYKDHDIHFDALFVLPWQLPRHVPDAV